MLVVVLKVSAAREYLLELIDQQKRVFAGIGRSTENQGETKAAILQ